MSFDDRLIYFILGCAVGAIVGYIVASLRYIREELDEVDNIVKHNGHRDDPPEGETRSRDERGAMKLSGSQVAILFVVLLTAWAAFASQKASHEAKTAQNSLAAVSDCNRVYLQKTIVALNERTTYTQESTKANVELQKSQATFFGILLHKPPYSQRKQNAAAQVYFAALNHFIDISEKSAQKVAQNPFPTDEELASCLRHNS